MNRLLKDDVAKRVYQVGEPIPARAIDHFDKFPDMTFNAPLDGSLALVKGVGPGTFQRTSQAVAWDDANRLKIFPPGIMTDGCYGSLHESTIQNKCTCHSVPRADNLEPKAYVLDVSKGVPSDWAGHNSAIPLVMVDGNMRANLLKADLGMVWKLSINYPSLFSKSLRVTFKARGTRKMNFGSLGNVYDTPMQKVESNPVTSPTTWQTYKLTTTLQVGASVFRIYYSSAGTVDGDWLEIKDFEIDAGIDLAGARQGWTAGSSSWATNFPNIVPSGDIKGFTEIVNDGQALYSAGLSNIVNTDKVYLLSNLTGSAAAVNTIGGTAGGTTQHYISCWARATGTGGNISDNGSVSVNVTSDKWQRIGLQAAQTAAAQVKITANPGGEVLYIIPQLEENFHISSEILTAGATYTRATSQLIFPGPGNLPAVDFTIYIEFTPEMNLPTASARQLRFIEVIPDANSALVLEWAAGKFRVTKKVATVSAISEMVASALVDKKLYKVAVAVWGTLFQITVNGVNGTVQTLAPGALPTAATMRVGLTNSTTYFNYNYLKNMRIYDRPFSAADLIELTS
jgi:hypothetical protein